MSEFKGTPGPWKARNLGTEIAVFGSYRLCGMTGGEIQRDKANARLIAAAPDLLDALLFAERRSKRDDEGHTEFFERLADEFHMRHGYLPPGKDDPLRNVSVDEARDAWDRFLAEPAKARRAAIAKALNTDTTER